MAFDERVVSPAQAFKRSPRKRNSNIGAFSIPLTLVLHEAIHFEHA